MKILAFTDIHGSVDKIGYVSVEHTLKRLENFKKAILKEKVDAVVCCGDFTYFGKHVKFLLQKIANLGVDILLIHGNHEDADEVRIYAKRFKNIHCIHKKAKIIGDYAFIGYGGDGFSRHDSEFVQAMKKALLKIPKGKKIILVTHGPPEGTKVDVVPGYGHVGSVDYREFIQKHKNIILSLCGHIHEGFEKRQQVNNALVLNPGPTGKIIELE